MPYPKPTRLREPQSVEDTWRQRLKKGRAELEAHYLANGNARYLLRKHCRLVDHLLAAIWRSYSWSTEVTMIAVGGYGRGELYPYSDIDLFILVTPDPEPALLAQIEQLIGLLWDAGLEVGHSVRTAMQALELAGQDISVQTNLLEGRYLLGDTALYQDFYTRFRAQIDIENFFLAKEREQHLRHLRYNDSAYNLEPNLKESPGGLRDLQNILWISQAAGLGNNWQALVKNHQVSASEANKLRDNERFLENLRIRLHYLAKRREDRLLFDYQTSLAETWGLEGATPHEKSEQIMQRYYRSAKIISVLNGILLQHFRGSFLPTHENKAIQLNNDFQIRSGLLELTSEQVFNKNPRAIFSCFLTLQGDNQITGFSAATLRALWRAHDLIGKEFRQDPVNRQLFLDIFRAPKGLTHALRLMNQYGILGRYLPAFGRIVGKMQHDLFHVYTVDEHILIVIRNLRRFTVAEFRHEYPLCSQIIDGFERPEVLYLAGLFHDIAKGRGGDHSTLGAVDVLRFCREHFISHEDSELIAWLVKNHLVMSSTAQKKDLSDPDVIAEFTQLVGNIRRLNALYLLTVADIRGTSPKVWNAWKGKLLQDLYTAARHQLEKGLDALADLVAARKREATHVLQQYLLHPESYVASWASLDDVYFLRHEAHEIAWHTRNVRGLTAPSEAIVKARLARHGEGVQVMIYAPDREDLFARLCVAFERTHYNIVEAKIYTTRTNYALNSFLVLDYANVKTHYRDLLSYIEYEVTKMLRQAEPPPPPLAARMSRHLKHFPMEPIVDIQPEGKGERFILSIIAGDRPGLLSRVAHVLLKHHVCLLGAKITTLGERAEDTFIIKGTYAALDEKRIGELKVALLQQL